MGLTQGLGEDVTNPPKHDNAKLKEVCWCRGATNLMEVNWVQDFMTLIRSSIREEVEDVVKRVVLPHLQMSALPSTSRSLPCQAESSASRSLHLHFVGTLPDTLLTLTNIQDEGASLIVELRDSFNSRVEVGPESCVKVKIVVLDGDFEEDKDDWMEEDFNRNVVEERKGKRPLLVGKYEITMNKGVAVISNISFTDNSKWMRSGNFRLGALVIKGLPPGVVVRPAVSKAFKVKERRLQSYRKHRTPSLGDEVWRLDNIAKNGPICQRLADQRIYTVQDFLQLYHTDAKKLQNILHVPDRKWPEIVKKAESCTLSSDCYRYHDDDVGVDLLLDCVFNVTSVTFNGETSQAYGSLNDSQKDLVNKLRCIAYKKQSELPKMYKPTNQIIVQAEPKCASTIAQASLQHIDNKSADQGMKSGVEGIFEATLEAEPKCASTIAQASLQHIDNKSADQGKELEQVNSQSPYPIQYSIQQEFNCEPGIHLDQIPSLDPDQWDELLAGLTLLQEDSSTVFEASTTDNATTKLKAACYVTKAAMMFMISIQQEPTPPRKKQKVR